MRLHYNKYTIHKGVQKLKTRTAIVLSTVSLALGGGTGVAVLNFSAAQAISGCITVTTSKGSLTTARLGGAVTGDVDATGCDIGAYFNTSNPGSVSTANIHDANQYGVFVDGIEAGSTSVNVTDSTIARTGNHTGSDFTPNGAQTGIGIYYYGFGDGNVSGNVSGNTVTRYQKGGIAANGSKANVSVTNNAVTGEGNIPFIAQNGVQFGYGAQGSAQGNTINGNWYTGADWSSTGLLLFNVNANQVKTSKNKFVGNQNNLVVLTTQACPHQYGGVYEDFGLCQ